MFLLLFTFVSSQCIFVIDSNTLSCPDCECDQMVTCGNFSFDETINFIGNFSNSNLKTFDLSSCLDLTTIKSNAFLNSTINTLILPGSLTEVEGYSFFNASVSQILFNKSEQNLNFSAGAFAYMNKLDELIVNRYAQLNIRLFEKSNNVSKIFFQNNTNIIPIGCFSELNYISGQITQLQFGEINLIDQKKGYLTFANSDIFLIEARAFSFWSIHMLLWGQNKGNISIQAFQSSSLSCIDLRGVENIEYQSFYNLTNLQGIWFNTSLNTIDNFSFYSNDDSGENNFLEVIIPRDQSLYNKLNYPLRNPRIFYDSDPIPNISCFNFFVETPSPSSMFSSSLSYSSTGTFSQTIVLSSSQMFYSSILTPSSEFSSSNVFSSTLRFSVSSFLTKSDLFSQSNTWTFRQVPFSQSWIFYVICAFILLFIVGFLILGVSVLFNSNESNILHVSEVSEQSSP